MKQYKVIGLMSGTSMDGVDMAHCLLSEEDGKWSYEITKAETVGYDEKWRLRLSKLNRQDAVTLWKTHVFYGKYLGRLIMNFVHRHRLEADFVASHGHTVFHDPATGYTCQIGDGASLAVESGLPVVCDFRSTDLALGGHGAPLVPVADRLLFGQYQYCLNLGGIANISGTKNGKLLAFDICPCNIGLNRVARNKGKHYDENGDIARSGEVHEACLEEMNDVDYYQNFEPKSMGREWINTDFWHITKNHDMTNEDKARTLVEHAAIQISEALYSYMDGDENILAKQQMLVTGGGAFNGFLMERIKAQSPVQVIVPDAQTIDSKEALAFALLGALRWDSQTNTLASVTGAKRDSIGGAVYLP